MLQEIVVEFNTNISFPIFITLHFVQVKAAVNLNRKNKKNVYI
jgi:hypothetical protein